MKLNFVFRSDYPEKLPDLFIFCTQRQLSRSSSFDSHQAKTFRANYVMDRFPDFSPLVFMFFVPFLEGACTLIGSGGGRKIIMSLCFFYTKFQYTTCPEIICF